MPNPAEKYWQNNIPRGIRATEAYQNLSHGHRYTLQVMADRGNRDKHTGDILNIHGGGKLYAVIGISRRTFWRHIRRLELAGLLVTTLAGYKVADRTIHNVYAIPHEPGSLQGCARARHKLTMQHTGGGYYERSKATEGSPDQSPTLFEPPAKSVIGRISPEVGSQNDTSDKMTLVTNCHGGPCQTVTGGRDKMAHYPPPSTPIDSPIEKSSQDDQMGRAKHLASWLFRIGWRPKWTDQHRTRVIRRDPTTALYAHSLYQERSQAILANGDQVQSPAALFATCWRDAGGS